MNDERVREIAERTINLTGLQWRNDEFEDVVRLLLDHATSSDEITGKLANVVAFSCLGNNHLWQDMNLRSRDELSQLLKTYFKPIYDKNYKDMKWKKFFYRQICGWTGFTSCRSPSCDVCIDYDECFGPESD